jgi:hypothetical protein
MEYFKVTSFQLLGDLRKRKEFYLIDFEENNDLPKGYSFTDYETKYFTKSKLIQEFPLRGKAVYLLIKTRRWRHKETRVVLKRDFTFIADSSKFTQELSDFLKDGSGYPRGHY